MSTPIKTKIRHFLGQWPSLFYTAVNLTNLKDRDDLLCQEDTDIVIEGYPRSANTFSVIAFKKSQSESKPYLKIAHHLHIEAQLIRAVKLGIPACALLREPEQAVSSFLIRYPDFDASWALKRYISFYSNITPFISDIYIAEFSEITSNFGHIIQGINKKFGTDFADFAHIQENQQFVFDSIEKINRELNAGKETYISIPSKTRRDILKKEKPLFDPGLLNKAQNLYKKLKNYS